MKKYNINNKHIALNTSYDNDNSFLSLFNVKTEGNISNPSTTISYDNKTVANFIRKLAERNLKKTLEKKLEKKFDNIIENLLE